MLSIKSNTIKLNINQFNNALYVTIDIELLINFVDSMVNDDLRSFVNIYINDISAYNALLLLLLFFSDICLIFLFLTNYKMV